MGCAQSKIENEESVSRCKDRRNFMKEAVTARNTFASGHSGYAMALKNTGAALSDYAQGEADEVYHPHLGGGGGGGVGGESSEPPPPPPPIMEHHLPPPPPPLPTYSPVPPPMPSFSPTPTPPLQRSVTMPAIPVTKKGGRKMNNGAILEEDEEEGEDEEEEDNVIDLRGRKGRKSGGRMAAEDDAPSPLTQTPVAPPPPPPESDKMPWDYFDMGGMPWTHLNEEYDEGIDEKDEEEEVEEEEQMDGAHHHLHHNNHHLHHHQVEPKTPEKVVMEGFTTEEEETPVMAKDRQFTHSNTAPPDINRRGGGNGGGGGMVVGSSSVNLLKIFGDIDDHFLKASESAQEVSKMLEATRMHYHSNFADNHHIDHAARVMRVITWNRSFKGAPNGDGGNEEYDDKNETHATVLDKLLAWEKKLYEEVKAGELMKLEYQRKVALLNKLKKRGASTESLEKTKAAVSHLHTRYIVDMQSLDSTVSEVNDIRDKQLYPKLVTLVDEMSKMWEAMCTHHENQLTVVLDLKSLDVSGAPKETTKHHYERTIQLYHVVQGWHSHFETLVTHQKRYIQALNNWLKLNLVPIESSLKEKISSPPRIQHPPIQTLLHSWHDHLQKLPDELAKSAISSFAAVIETIMNHQEEEMKLKEKWEETRKEYLRKNQAFEDWCQKYAMRRGPQDETDPDRISGTDPNDPISERRFVVETLKKRLDDEIEAHQKLCVQVRDKSLGSLKIRLPELFRAMSDYAHVCRDSYKRLRSIVHSQNHPNGN
ncbi:nitrate regulatory gene2 protein isoform X2 [Cynara cardunculus var. scolymus]|uniref:nitrate regulatory gene2 protein isoform X2 n=1 Tax=Cynara cardunculus var. scolymus TaxID=59895 RepID=UPI000D623896|nr:nitrate regulatory gene2 protein isoform X2 [Cynara cardunculus var. scolymus]